LLTSLEERSTHRELGCFFGVEDKDGLERDDLVNETAGDIFALLWKAIALPAVKAFPYFWE